MGTPLRSVSLIFPNLPIPLHYEGGSRENFYQTHASMQKLLTGKNTIEAAHIISQAFISIFGTKYGTSQEIVSKLILRGKSPTWASLDRNLNLFCRQFYESWEENEDKINFFDELRFIIQNLPQRQDYKIPPEKLEFKDPEKAQEYFTTCAHCWRTVFKKPLQKVKALCHLHDLPSTHSEYRKRERLKKYQEIIKHKLLKTLPPLSLVKQELEAGQKQSIKQEKSTNLNNYLQAECLNKNGSFPYLSKYLHSLAEKHALPLSTGKNILQALEYPIYQGQTKTIPIWYQAFDFYLTDRGEHFRLNYLRLLNTEAWLQVEAEHRYGGKRQPKKN